MTVQDAFLAQLDTIWATKREPKGAQDDPETDPKRVQNRAQHRSKQMIEKWTIKKMMQKMDYEKIMIRKNGLWYHQNTINIF